MSFWFLQAAVALTEHQKSQGAALRCGFAISSLTGAVAGSWGEDGAASNTPRAALLRLTTILSARYPFTRSVQFYIPCCDGFSDNVVNCLGLPDWNESMLPIYAWYLSEFFHQQLLTVCLYFFLLFSRQHLMKVPFLQDGGSGFSWQAFPAPAQLGKSFFFLA